MLEFEKQEVLTQCSWAKGGLVRFYSMKHERAQDETVDKEGEDQT